MLKPRNLKECMSEEHSKSMHIGAHVCIHTYTCIIVYG